MPANRFSEFTFGFAFTQEVTTMCWEALAGAPEIPSLFDEGHGKGFDVSLGLWGWTLFAQFKRGSLLTRSTALQWATYGASYYRFEIYPASRSAQHSDLMQLEASAPLHWVAYVSPVFHTSNELNALFTNRQVLDSVRMISPSAIGTLSDELHFVTYQTRVDTALVHSEPVPLESISVDSFRQKLHATDWRRDDDAQTSGQLLAAPMLLNDEYFDSITAVMKESASETLGERTVVQLTSGMESMTSFGRARTTGRLLFGAELLALPAGGQQVG